MYVKIRLTFATGWNNQDRNGSCVHKASRHTAHHQPPNASPAVRAHHKKAIRVCLGEAGQLTGEFVHILRAAWGVGMAEKSITIALCPGGSLRMERLLWLLVMKRVDPTKMTTHTFPFEQLDMAFDIMEKKKDGVLKPLITFDS